MKTRTVGAIALNPTGNQQGDYYFMSLVTGVRLSRHQWTEMPITPEVIARVEEIATQQNQLDIRGGSLLFKWRPNMPLDDDDENDGDGDNGPDPERPNDDAHPVENQGADNPAIDAGEEEDEQDQAIDAGEEEDGHEFANRVNNDSDQEDDADIDKEEADNASHDPKNVVLVESVKDDGAEEQDIEQN